MKIKFSLCLRIYTWDKKMICATNEVILLSLEKIVIEIVVVEIFAFCGFYDDETDRVIIK